MSMSMRMVVVAMVISRPADNSSHLKARTALTVYQAQDKRLGIQKKKGTLVDRARAEALVFRLARQERDPWVCGLPNTQRPV